MKSSTLRFLSLIPLLAGVTVAGAALLDDWAQFDSMTGPGSGGGTYSYCATHKCPDGSFLHAGGLIGSIGCLTPGTTCCAHYNCHTYQVTDAVCCGSGTSCTLMYDPGFGFYSDCIATP